MSLINQMLRDLQGRQKGGRSTPQALPSRSATASRRLPPLFLAGGGGLLGLLLLWWLAGALAGLMLPDPPALPLTAAPPAALDAPVAAGPAVESAAEPLPSAPVANVDSSVPPVPEEPAAARRAESLQSEAPALVSTAPAPARTTASPAPPAVKPQPKPAVAAARPNSAPVAPPVAKRPATVVARLHPDDLPGALLASSRSLSGRAAVPPPSATPFGEAEVAFRAGNRAYRFNNTSLAVTELQKALALYPGHLPARELLVDIHEMSGHTGQAMQLLAAGLEIAPDYMPLKKRYVRLLIDQGDLATAVTVLQQSGLPAIVDDPEAHVLLASLYQRLDEPFLAAQTYRNLLVVWPQTGAFWVGLGSALEDQGLPGEARKAFERALAVGNLGDDLSSFARQRLARP